MNGPFKHLRTMDLITGATYIPPPDLMTDGFWTASGYEEYLGIPLGPPSFPDVLASLTHPVASGAL